ncbi:MAG: hypothetical protein CMI54_09035 [Parcubacteria group bacterium]|jgi:hypothetical protein|nr:hypothetical protein [Parcubacteria group bacterium]|tara:strand:+ start:3800 stop:4027 length:228 start_codon:yes stop_codon:yes gene_type:complete
MINKTPDRSELIELEKKLEGIRKQKAAAHQAATRSLFRESESAHLLSLYEELARTEIELLEEIREASKKIIFHMD